MMSSQIVSDDSYKFSCARCGKRYKSERYYHSHLQKCKKGATPQQNALVPDSEVSSIQASILSEQTNSSLPRDEILPQISSSETDITPTNQIWGKCSVSLIEKKITSAYEKIVHWKKNIFLLPSGKAGKDFINEMTRLVCEWNNDSPLKTISLKALMIMPSLLLQKPSKTSKAKDHTDALKRRILLWKEGDIENLVLEAETIQGQLNFRAAKRQ